MTARLSLTPQALWKNGAVIKTAPAGNRGLTSRWASRQEALVSIFAPGSDTNTEARRTAQAVVG